MLYSRFGSRRKSVELFPPSSSAPGVPLLCRGIPGILLWRHSHWMESCRLRVSEVCTVTQHGESRASTKERKTFNTGVDMRTKRVAKRQTPKLPSRHRPSLRTPRGAAGPLLSSSAPRRASTCSIRHIRHRKKHLAPVFSDAMRILSLLLPTPQNSMLRSTRFAVIQ